MEIFYLFINECNLEGTKRNKEHSLGRFLVDYASKNFFKLENSEIIVLNNKPCFKHSNIQFSISHSKNLVMACFDINPVGFDVEFIKQRNYSAISERMKFHLQDNTLEEFYKCWTKYEAEYKLQEKAKNIHTEKFMDKYIISSASNSIDKISFNFHKIIKNDCI